MIRIWFIAAVGAAGSFLTSCKNKSEDPSASVLSASLSAQSLNPEGGSIMIQIKTELGWELERSGRWLAYERNRGNGSDTVEVQYQMNESDTVRKGILSVTAENRKYVRSFTLSQPPKPYWMISDNHNEDFKKSAQHFPVEIHAQGTWELWVLPEDTSWLKFETPHGNGNATVQIFLKENLGNDTRHANFILNHSGVLQDVAYVHQHAN